MDESNPQKRKRLDSDTNVAPKKSLTNTAAAEAEEESDDCQILEKNITTIELDSDIETSFAAVTKSSADDSDSDYVWVEKKDVPPSVEDCPKEPDAPLLRVNFRDAQSFSQLKNTIHQSIRDALFKLKITVQIDEESSDFVLKVSETTQTEDCVFIVDANPNTDNTKKPNKKDVPQYDLNVAKVLDHTIPQPAADDSDTCKRDARPKNMCFNCDGDHNMRDCKEPKDQRKIQKNRSQFSTNRVERYHIDLNQRFGQFLPGVLSEPLREALRIRDNEVPLHIYRMRLLGYPPGWLEDAKVSQSGLALIVDHAKTDERNDVEAVKYDLSKIVSFPGFNVDPAPGFFDMSYNLRLPQIGAHQSKKIMIESLRSQSTQSYKRQKMKDMPATNQEERTVDLSNPQMDIDDGELSNDVPLSESTKPNESQDILLPPGTEGHDEDSPQSPADLNERSGNPDSPSLDDLRKQQQLLLAALDDSTVGITQTPASPPAEGVDDSLIDDILALETTQASSCAGDDTINNTISCTSPDPPNTNETLSEPVTPMNSSKHSVSGTPLIESASPYSSLPVGACWSAGVSDVIDFENLADSTGKFEKMRRIIDKVRETVKELHDEYEQ